MLQWRITDQRNGRETVRKARSAADAIDGMLSKNERFQQDGSGVDKLLEDRVKIHQDRYDVHQVGRRPEGSRKRK